MRTWAAKIAPAYPWPGGKDKAFGPLWTGWAGVTAPLCTPSPRPAVVPGLASAQQLLVVFAPGESGFPHRAAAGRGFL
ncbi:hypothetical protein Shyhy01_75440 [Streptomyces hygroscopicus subsp. hygroscopicus]|nr:hypothetical protein Shyhy01_75440 [Streptomyces hygroscopicus subsp. hygroscopicus]